MRTYAASYEGKNLLADGFRQALANSAMKSIELAMTGDYTPQQRRQLADLVRDMQNNHELKVASIHLPFCPFNAWPFTDADESVRQASVKALYEFMAPLAGIVTHNFTIHCGGEPNAPETRQAKMDQMIRTCHDLLPMMEQFDASLNLEVLPRTCIGRNPEDLLYILSDLPRERFNICFDINHLCNRPKDVPQLLQLCGDRLRALHVSDYDGVDECHWFVGHGILNWPAIITTLRSIPQDLLCIIETSHLTIPQKDRPMSPALLINSSEEDATRMEFAVEFQAFRERMNQANFIL